MYLDFFLQCTLIGDSWLFRALEYLPNNNVIDFFKENLQSWESIFSLSLINTRLYKNSKFYVWMFYFKLLEYKWVQMG